MTACDRLTALALPPTRPPAPRTSAPTSLARPISTSSSRVRPSVPCRRNSGRMPLLVRSQFLFSRLIPVCSLQRRSARLLWRRVPPRRLCRNPGRVGCPLRRDGLNCGVHLRVLVFELSFAREATVLAGLPRCSTALPVGLCVCSRARVIYDSYS